MLLRALALLALVGASSAQDEENPLERPEHGPEGLSSWSFRLGLFDQSDDGEGNPFLDEALTVIEPVLLYESNISERTRMAAQLSYDNVSSASIERLNKFDGQSGASADNYIGVDVGFSYLWDSKTDVGWNLHLSNEYDYNSIGLGGSWARELAGGNARVATSLSVYEDFIDIIRFDGSQDEGTDNRTSISLGSTWYQIISPKLHGEFGINIGAQSGFLETPYNAVVVEDPMLPPNPNLDNMARGYEITEELPDSRLRTALHGKLRRSLGEGHSMQLAGRIYQDDWGIASFSLEPSYHRMLNERWMWAVRYRFYSQGEADAYSDSFTSETEERTQDADLGDFDAQTIGTRFTWFKTQRTTWDFGIDFTDRSDGLDHLYASFGWRLGF